MNSNSEKNNQVSDQKYKQATQPSLLIKLNQLGFQLFGQRLPVLMSWWALKLWSRTHRSSATHREKRMQLRANECSLEVNGKTVKAWTWGTGPGVLLIHGWNGRGLQLNRFIDPLLNAGYQVICFDAPAHGQTPGKHTHLLEIRDVIVALSKQHGPLHAAISHSFGVACLSAAVSTGMSLPAVVAISSPGGLSNLIARYCRAMHIPKSTEQCLRQRLSHRLGETLWQRFAQTYPISEGVERSLVVHDKEDKLVSYQKSQQLAEHWPNAELILTEGLGHQRILLDTATVNKVVAFIENTIVCDSLNEFGKN